MNRYFIITMISLYISHPIAAGENINSKSGELPVTQRIAGRSYPSVFQAWSPADNIKNEDKLTTAARHDLLFSTVGFFGLKWNHKYPGLATGFTPESIQQALKTRQSLLTRNPHIVLLAEIRYRDASPHFLSPDHKWWRRDKSGKPALGWKEGGYIQLNFDNPQYRRHVAARARAAMQSGVLDGIMLDWWRDKNPNHIELLKAVRQAIGESALIIVNPNINKIPNSAAMVNGLFMECGSCKAPESWTAIADTLVWAEKNLRKPTINCVETWYHHSRNDLPIMRAITTLTLTFSDGYCLFSDPNPLPTWDHLHNWYSFWDKRLGKPLGPGGKKTDGAVYREYENGTVVYNPPGNKEVAIHFQDKRLSVASEKQSNVHVIKPADGDIFVKLKN